MNISASVENNPALILLKNTIQPLSLPSPPVQQLSDSVNISDVAQQRANAVANPHS